MIRMSSKDVERAAAIIRRGGLVAFPTETVYGLGANALDPVAVERIYAAKGRPATSPLIVHVDSVAMAKSLVVEWPPEADILTEKFWPGPLTLVLRKHPKVPDIVTAGLDTVGLRMPSHPTALALIEAAGVPIAAPSANLFTQLSATTAEHVRRSLGDLVDMILDGGPTTVSIESTVLSLAGPEPILLRPGMISQGELETFVGPICRASATPGPQASPGLEPRHYRPRTPLFLGPPLDRGKGAYLWIHHLLPAARVIAMPTEASEYAAHLYELLHQLDTQGLDYIAVERPPAEPSWAGILDRLQRAAENR
jgi:L-threonylcarbamoyladenylate synthase